MQWIFKNLVIGIPFQAWTAQSIGRITKLNCNKKNFRLSNYIHVYFCDVYKLFSQARDITFEKFGLHVCM